MFLADVVVFHFVQTVQKMLGTSVQTVVKIWVSIDVQSLSLVEGVVPQGLGMTEAMHMAQQIVMCPQLRHCQLMTEAKLGNRDSGGHIHKDFTEMLKHELYHPFFKQHLYMSVR